MDEANVFDATHYSRSYLWCVVQQFPNIDQELWKRPGRDFKPGDTLVIVARPPQLFDRVRTLLNDLNLEPKEISTKAIVDEEGPYEILVVAVAKKQSY